jgi:hypothetical protein
MTTDLQIKPKQIPAFYIFAPGADGKNQRVSAAFKHEKGDGISILIGNARYAAFPPKS